MKKFLVSFVRGIVSSITGIWISTSLGFVEWSSSWLIAWLLSSCIVFIIIDISDD